MKLTIENIHAHCDEVGDCWEWKGGMSHTLPSARDSDTGKVVNLRRWLVAERVAKHPKLVAVATCLNPRCVNPEHTIAVTRKQLQQRTAKTTVYANNEVRKHRIAEKRRQRGTTLDMDKAREMRALGLSTRAAAQIYGCAVATAADALAGRTWREASTPFTGLGAR